MKKVKTEQLNTLDYIQLPIFQKQASEELQSSLNKIINEEVSKYSKKMTETTIAVCNNKMSKCKTFTEKLQQQLNEKQAIIDNLKVKKENLQNQLATCSKQIDNQQKQILAQQNDLESKSKRIQVIEKAQIEKDSLVNKQRNEVDKLKLKIRTLQFAYYRREEDRLDLSFLIISCKCACKCGRTKWELPETRIKKIKKSRKDQKIIQNFWLKVMVDCNNEAQLCDWHKKDDLTIVKELTAKTQAIPVELSF